MTVRSDRHFRFDVDRGTLWGSLTDVGEYQRWWPWLREFDGRTFEPGTQWQCVVVAPLRYTLRFELTLVGVHRHSSVRAAVRGDLVGAAELSLIDRGSASELRLWSALDAERHALRWIEMIAPPLARRTHDRIVETGVRQFRAALAR